MKLPRIIAVDFDGCLVEDAWPAIGAPIQSVIDALKAKQTAGYKIILSTCRRGERLKEAVAWCAEQGIEFDAVNENLPEVIQHYGGDTRKISADEYWGDDARQMPERACSPVLKTPYHGVTDWYCGICKTCVTGGQYCPECGTRVVQPGQEEVFTW